MSNQAQPQAIMYIKLDSYLEETAALERAKPPGKRRSIPQKKEIAEAIGITPTALSRIIKGKVGLLRLNVGATIISLMRQRGFPMEVGDLIAYRELKSDEG